MSITVAGGNAQRSEHRAPHRQAGLQLHGRVDALRSFPVMYLSDGIPQRQRLISIILHHQVMAAGPLMAIYRNMIFEMLTQEGAAQSQQEKDATRSVLRHICTRVQKLIETRNELLH